jgi:hypothetical protein
MESERFRSTVRVISLVRSSVRRNNSVLSGTCAMLASVGDETALLMRSVQTAMASRPTEGIPAIVA